MPGPLAGIRVLEFSQIVAGPFAGLSLSDLGADVVKVEPPEGETRRNSAAVVPNEGKYFQSLNRGKRSLTVNLAQPGGPGVIHAIIPTFDVVVSNYRFGVAQRLNIDYPTLSKLRPDLIYANITGFGDRGPFATRGGSDIVAQAYSGLMAAEAKVDDFGAPASIASTTIIDRASGLAAAMGICAALFHRANTGLGQEIHVSLVHTALELQAPTVMREPVHDAVVRDPLLAQFQSLRAGGARYGEIAALRRAQGPRFASHRLYYGGYHTKEGALVLGAVTRGNRDAIRAIIGMADETDQPDFNAADQVNRERIEAWRLDIQEIFLNDTAASWVERFLDAGVPASVVNFAEEMSDDPHILASGMMVELEHEVTGPQRVVAPIVRLSVTPSAASRPAPMLASHTREVLLEAGLGGKAIDELVDAGVVTEA